MNYINLVNNALAAIGKEDIIVVQPDHDLFELGLTSIDKMLLLLKVEELAGRKIQVAKLGVSPTLTVEKLVDCLGEAT